ncbi:nitroreductase family protein [Seohaeicola saemankumensis]|uniref:nitroreductase family protein n=1 Tax=Seohaeicola saemankumensis TaxID=481181 RepID=UPI0035D0A6C5
MSLNLRARMALFRNCWYDMRRYARYSFAIASRGRENRRAIIRILTHYLEGGESFPEIRLGFGQEKAHSIIAKIETYVADYDVDDTVLWAHATLKSYLSFHRAQGMPLTDIEEKQADQAARLAIHPRDGAGGSELVSAADIQKAVDFDFEAFLRNRHSVRQYTPERVSDGQIRKIVANVQQSPNVCNRQTCRVYAYNDRETVQKILPLQAGNAGFRQEISTLFVVTANLEHLNLIGERYQGWIDGGIFAMTLALAIHAEGLGACFLNWSVEQDADQTFRRALGIPDNEIVITCMSAGHLKDEFRVPVSARKPLEDVLVLNGPLAI